MLPKSRFVEKTAEASKGKLTQKLFFLTSLNSMKTFPIIKINKAKNEPTIAVFLPNMACLLISKPASLSKIVSFHELFLLLNQEKLPLQSYRPMNFSMTKSFSQSNGRDEEATSSRKYIFLPCWWVLYCFFEAYNDIRPTSFWMMTSSSSSNGRHEEATNSRKYPILRNNFRKFLFLNISSLRKDSEGR